MKWLNRKSSQGKKKNASKISRRKPFFEILEDRTVPAPVDFQPTLTSTFQPDVSVWDAVVLDGRRLEQPPHLAVEVLSPSNPEHDLVRKLHAYARHGVLVSWAIQYRIATSSTRCWGSVRPGRISLMSSISK